MKFYFIGVSFSVWLWWCKLGKCHRFYSIKASRSLESYLDFWSMQNWIASLRRVIPYGIFWSFCWELQPANEQEWKAVCPKLFKSWNLQPLPVWLPLRTTSCWNHEAFTALHAEIRLFQKLQLIHCPPPHRCVCFSAGVWGVSGNTTLGRMLCFAQKAFLGASCSDGYWLGSNFGLTFIHTNLFWKWDVLLELI